MNRPQDALWANLSLCSMVIGLMLSTSCNRTESAAQTYCRYGDPEQRTGTEPSSGGFSGPGLEGCLVGYIEIGPDPSQNPESACRKRFDVASIPLESDSIQWAELTNAMIDRRTGCLYGAQGNPPAPEPVDAGLPGGVE